MSLTDCRVPWKKHGENKAAALEYQNIKLKGRQINKLIDLSSHVKLGAYKWELYIHTKQSLHQMYVH